MLIDPPREELEKLLLETSQKLKIDYRKLIQAFPDRILVSAHKRKNFPNNCANLMKSLRKGELTLNQANILSRYNLIGVDEITSIYHESKKVLMEKYGIEIPDYMVFFNPQLNATEFRTGQGLAFFFGIISLPEEAKLNILDIVPHEQGHAYHMENSEIYRFFKRRFPDMNTEERDLMKNQSKKLIEGIACYISLLHSRHLDEEFGFDGEFEKWNREQVLFEEEHYSKGLELFKKIEKRDGIEGVLNAANNLMTDEELERFAKEQ